MQNTETPVKTLYISDISRCRPFSALSRTPRDGCWTLVDYETAEGVKGVMAFADPIHNAPEITLPIEVEGEYKIYLGINFTRSCYVDSLHTLEFCPYGDVQVKLSDDLSYTRVTLESGWPITQGKLSTWSTHALYRSVQESYWKTADLTGQSLQIRPMDEPYDGPDTQQFANISYVKLVPLTEAEKKVEARLKKNEETRNMAYIFCSAILCGHAGGSGVFYPESEQWYREEYAPCVDNDIGIFIFDAIRGNLCCYPTQIGDTGFPDNEWPDDKPDPMATFAKLARENDHKVFAALRFMGTGYPIHTSPISRATHYWENQKWAKRDKDGLPTSTLSLGFPEVRDYWLSLLREVLTYDIDGVVLYLNRSHPPVMYEEPVVREFVDIYGEDPRDLDKFDPRWKKHGAGYLTQFLRQVRSLLNEKAGRSLAVMFLAQTANKAQQANFSPMMFNCDVDTWLKEEIVDYLLPSPAVSADLIRGWRKLAGDRIHIWPNMEPRFDEATNQVDRAKVYYEAGADGLTLWDAERRPPHMSEWATVRHLGHKDDLEVLRVNAEGHYKIIRLKMLNGLSAQESWRDG